MLYKKVALNAPFIVGRAPVASLRAVGIARGATGADSAMKEQLTQAVSAKVLLRAGARVRAAKVVLRVRKVRRVKHPSATGMALRKPRLKELATRLTDSFTRDRALSSTARAQGHSATPSAKSA